MSDPRFNGSHLCVARHDQYDAAVDELVDSRGPLTAVSDPLVRQPAHTRIVVLPKPVPPGGLYTLVNLDDGRRHELRVGINAIGRFPENDIVLHETCVSRRHCAVLVHATDGCEVYDTASRNGTWVNRERVARVHLTPGDIIMLAGQQLLVAWTGPNGEVFPDWEDTDIAWPGGASPTGHVKEDSNTLA